MKRFLKSKKGIALLATLVVAAAAAVGAYAYFTSTGSGTGTATVGSATNWYVNQTATSSAKLYPDAAPGGANIASDTYTVQNQGSGSQYLTSVQISVATSTGGTWTNCVGGSNSGDVSGGNCTDGTYSGQPACTASDFSIDGLAAGTPKTDTAAAGDFTASQSKPEPVTVEMIDSGSSQNNCQGVTVPLYYYAS